MVTDGCNDDRLAKCRDVDAHARPLAGVAGDERLGERSDSNASLTAQRDSLGRVMADWNGVPAPVPTARSFDKMAKANLAKRIWRRTTNSIRLASVAARSDAVLVSYPKSGRTWFRFILSTYFARAFGLGLDVDLHSMFTVLPNFDMDPVRGFPAFAFGQFRPKLPLVPVSHLGHQRRLFLNRPVIFMVRDPRDLIVSAYFHATRQKHRFQGDIGQFISDRDHGLPSLVRYLNGWSAGVAARRAHVLSYENLSSNTEHETAKVLSFLGCEINLPELARAVEASRFSSMQEQERSMGLPAHDYDRSDSESLRMRRGQVGGFADYLDVKQIAMIEGTCARELTLAAKKLLASTGLPLAAC
ncbi:sulfotransferase domain-containing protein [Mesorhizobium sp. M00.F.Ca.ET.216.01.1.1]|uniref:sulfotransferase domain-containing protein n=1 Tax=Mesorhizobium sp. M00.F.Ca.ET.216.01.1.1 TaxID=2500528 RepID=UPI001FE056DF|nr:sulfotransferase domain-containing protein [Mesorhizobium sp. M00.F.Ca.ET.216.01.1.1]